MLVRLALRDANPLFDKLYTYEWDEKISASPEGFSVMVPFGRSDALREAYVLEVSDDEASDEPEITDRTDALKENKGKKSKSQNKYKKVLSAVYPFPVLTHDQIVLAKQLRIRYAVTYGDVLRLMLPPGMNAGEKIRVRKEKTVCVKEGVDVEELIKSGSIKSIKQLRVLEYLSTAGECSLSELRKINEVSDYVPSALVKKGLLCYGEREKDFEAEYEAGPDKSEENINSQAVDGGLIPKLSHAQENNIKILQNAVFKPEYDKRRIKEYLLHGVTGSGKTEVYLKLAGEILASGGSCMILVPEIALTPQMMRRFSSRFGNELALIHSRLGKRERFEEWRSLKEGRVRLLLGARSAVFMPMKNLRLIVLDEEHDSSYRSDSTPHYDARTVARLRARDRSCILLLGSATPSVESYYRTENGRSRLLRLPFRIAAKSPTEIIISDMKQERAGGEQRMFSSDLTLELSKCLKRGEQAMLFINRRGHSSMFVCRNCGNKLMCPDCSVNLSYHKAGKNGTGLLVCHYCGHIESAPESCPRCGSFDIDEEGPGTQQVEEEVKRLFPGVKVLRMDQDTTYTKEKLNSIIKDFEGKKADVLVGTQMIAKGHDIESVTLVGIINCDQLLGGEDFRSNERGFQLITQASGRAGRGSLAGKVVLQTYDPLNRTLLQAAREDYEAFYQDEIDFRSKLQYPPFSSIVVIIISSSDRNMAEKSALKLSTELSAFIASKRLGSEVKKYPLTPAYPARLFGKSRYRIMVKAADEKFLSDLMFEVKRLKISRGVNVTCRLDPA